MLRVALCIVGELRDHFEGGIAAAVKRSLLSRDDWSVDIFIDTSLRNASLFDLQRFYGPRLASLHVERDPSNVTFALDSVRLPSFVFELDPVWSRSTLPNFHRMYRCNEAKRRRMERSEGWRYDAVVKMRPDSKFCTPKGGILHPEFVAAVERVLEGRAVFLQADAAIAKTVQVSDKYAVGTSQAMDFYMGLFPELPRVWADMRSKRDHYRNALVGERLLFHYMDKYAPFDFRTYFAACPARPPVVRPPEYARQHKDHFL